MILYSYMKTESLFRSPGFNIFLEKNKKLWNVVLCNEPKLTWTNNEIKDKTKALISFKISQCQFPSVKTAQIYI